MGRKASFSPELNPVTDVELNLVLVIDCETSEVGGLRISI